MARLPQDLRPRSSVPPRNTAPRSRAEFGAPGHACGLRRRSRPSALASGDAEPDLGRAPHLVRHCGRARRLRGAAAAEPAYRQSIEPQRGRASAYTRSPAAISTKPRRAGRASSACSGTHQPRPKGGAPSEDRSQRSLPLRQRKEVQAVLRGQDEQEGDSPLLEGAAGSSGRSLRCPRGRRNRRRVLLVRSEQCRSHSRLVAPARPLA